MDGDPCAFDRLFPTIPVTSKVGFNFVLYGAIMSSSRCHSKRVTTMKRRIITEQRCWDKSLLWIFKGTVITINWNQTFLLRPECLIRPQLFLYIVGSPQSNSRSTSRSTTVNDSESQDEADDEYEEDDDFLGNGSDLWTRTNSALSERGATFYNHHKAFYKFVCEEDSSRTEIKITLGFSDRLKLPAKVKNILCVLYTRKDSDRSARKFLKRLPRQLLKEAIGEERIMCCDVFSACQTLWEVWRGRYNTQRQTILVLIIQTTISSIVIDLKDSYYV